MSRLIQNIIAERKLEGVYIATLVRIIDLLFVDYILLFGKGIVGEWIVYKELLDTFCLAMRMKISANKTAFLVWGMEEEDFAQLRVVFPFEFKPLYSALKYLGYFLKSNHYTKEHWMWLLKKFKRRLGRWYNRWLSLGGKYILEKVVLENISVYRCH